MGKKSKIPWVDASWNPWLGCHPTSEGCHRCYAARWARRWGRDFSIVKRTSKHTFRAPLKWSARTIFVCSHSDFFLKEADEWRDDAWAIMRATPQHNYKILTKRPERILRCLPADWPLPHVQLGVTVELQKYEDRIQQMLKANALINFVSCEPLLGPINLRAWLPYLDQIIAGGESGPKHRIMELDWARSLRDQCIEFGVPFFFKQISALRPGTDPYLDGIKWEQPAKTSNEGGNSCKQRLSFFPQPQS